MFHMNQNLKGVLAVEPVDLRKSFSGLYVMARSGLNEIPENGALFVFSNRSRNRVKVLCFDGSELFRMRSRIRWKSMSRSGPVRSESAVSAWSCQPICRWSKSGKKNWLFFGSAEAGQALLRAGGSFKVDGGEGHRVGFMAASISRTEFSKPWKTERAMMLWPMLSVSRCGIVRMPPMLARLIPCPALTCKPRACAQFAP